MKISTADLAKARVAAERLLDSLELEAYLYEVEPVDGGEWTMVLECATGDGWQRTNWTVGGEELLASLDDDAVRARLRERLARRTTACRSR